MHEQQLRALDYLARKGTNAPVEILRAQLRSAFDRIEKRFDQVAADRRSVAPAPRKWSAHQILDHLVLSHAPAVAQFASLLAGVTPGGIAIPAHLSSTDADRPAWDALRTCLGAIHADVLLLLDGASDALSLEPKAIVEIVVTVDAKPLQWSEPVDWKALIQGLRVHTLEHDGQLERTAFT